MHANGCDERPDLREDELTAALRDALRPEPLPNALTARIQAEFDRRQSATRPPWRVALRVAGLAAAACLLFALLLPWRSASPVPVAAGGRASPSAEAAAILAVFETLSWDSALEQELDMAAASVAAVREMLAQEQAVANPGTSSDDWDLPPPAEAGSSQSRAAPPTLGRVLTQAATGC